LDFGLNFNRHGLWHEPRNWTLDPPKKKKKGTDIAPVKECPACGMMVSASAASCECGYIWPRKEKPLLQGTMVQVADIMHLNGLRVGDLNLAELKALQDKKVYKASYIWRIVRSRGIGAIEKYAQLCKYESGWVYRQKMEIHNSKYNDYRVKIAG
jgi:hypothetical protein